VHKLTRSTAEGARWGELNAGAARAVVPGPGGGAVLLRVDIGQARAAHLRQHRRGPHQRAQVRRAEPAGTQRHVRVNPTRAYVNPNQACVNLPLLCVNPTQVGVPGGHRARRVRHHVHRGRQLLPRQAAAVPERGEVRARARLVRQHSTPFPGQRACHTRPAGCTGDSGIPPAALYGSSTHPLTHSLTHSPTHSPTHSLTGTARRRATPSPSTSAACA
jgi:hypothetical protein